MTADRSISSSVEVPTDPVTAFEIFTEEIDCWWIQGPINFHDTARAYAKRIEPGIGGRLLEVYDLETGDGLETGRITAWEPGSRFAWTSLIDDVRTEVSFESVAGGTRVRVDATIPEGGQDQGTTSWVRMTPQWFAPWVAKRDHVPHEPMRMARLAVAVHYTKPATAARWLNEVFGLEPAGDLPEVDTDSDHTWIEFHVGNCSLMVFARAGDPVEGATPSHTPWVFVDDLDAHRAQAERGGATNVGPIIEHGSRFYEVEDLEGNRWTFAQASPLMLLP